MSHTLHTLPATPVLQTCLTDSRSQARRMHPDGTG